MHTTNIVAIITLVVIIGGGIYFSTQSSAPEAMEKKEVMMAEKDGTMMEDKKMEGQMMEKAPEGAMLTAGQYIPYAAEKLAMADTGDVVLFFRASWCPTCKAVDADIKAHLKDIPKGVTILDVDYDNSSELKKKYGVTYQHTFVQVAADGTQIVKWSASPTLASLLGNIK